MTGIKNETHGYQLSTKQGYYLKHLSILQNVLHCKVPVVHWSANLLVANFKVPGEASFILILLKCVLEKTITVGRE